MLMNENPGYGSFVDLQSLATELHLRGFDQQKVDSALRCLVHVYAVQNSEQTESGGILAEDLVSTYSLEVVQAASELFLEKSMLQGREVFRVRWGCEDSARTMEERLWENSSGRWETFVSELDDRYLGFFLPEADEGARVVSNWKLGNDLKWFSVEMPQHGWKVLDMMEDLTEVAWKLDLAFGFRPFGADGVGGQRALLHAKAYEVLKNRKQAPPEELRRLIRLWKFFSEYDVEATDFVALMKDCGLTLEEIIEQVKRFFALGLTSQYRDGQYPPYFIDEKKKKEFQAAVRGLLQPMDVWLSRREVVPEAPAQRAPVTVEEPAQA